MHDIFKLGSSEYNPGQGNEQNQIKYNVISFLIR